MQFFFKQQMVKNPVWKLQFRNTIFNDKYSNTKARNIKFDLFQIHATQPIYNHVCSD